MQKYILNSLLLLLTGLCIGQKPYHNVFVSPNLTATGLGMENSGNQNYDNFKNPRFGFNTGYRFILPINKTLSVGTGLTYRLINSEFTRMHFDNSVTGTPRGLREKNRLSRLAIPAHVYINLVNGKKVIGYVLLGYELIILNRTNRTADYYIPSTSGNFIKGRFKGNQAIKFGKSDKSLGSSFITALGAEFKIKERDFTGELAFFSDLSKNKFLSLKNIENDAFFFGKFKGLQLTIGTSFSLLRKKDK